MLDFGNNSIARIEQGELWLQMANLGVLILDNNDLNDAALPLCLGRWASVRQLGLEGNLMKRFAPHMRKGTEAVKRYLRQWEGVED